MAKLITRREADSRKVKFQAFAGMFDFLGIVFGIMVIVACVILLESMYSWIVNDSNDTFTALLDILNSALIRPF